MSAKPVKAPAAVDGGPAAVSSASVPNPAGGEGAAEKKSSINLELWQACAGPLVNLPAAGTLVYYFPQGHSEQVAASMKKDADAQIPNYPNLPSKLLCLLHNVALHADLETDEVYAQMTLQPVPSYDREALLRSDLSLKSNRPQPEFFCKTLTASDTSTHGGFSVPRRAAEKIFPPLDFAMQPPVQELMARDLHDNVWNFRHIYRGQPKRHLLTTGWSLFVSGKRLFAGDSVLFIRDEKQQLLLGIRRANRQSPNLSSSVLSSDSMHIGILAAAAHAASNSSPFSIYYNPRTSPSEFVIPLAKYYKAVYSNQISLGMRFRMMFETEDSGTRRYMGTITGISDLDPVRWKNSQWRNFQVGWDESTTGERRSRVSIWEIEPVTAPFFICPPPFFRSKRPRQPGMLDEDSTDLDLFKRTMPWLSDDLSMKDPQALSGLSLVQWMNMQQSSSVAASMQPNYAQPMSGSVMQNLGGADLSRQFGLPAPPLSQPNNLQFRAQRMSHQAQQVDQLQRLPMQSALNPMGSVVQSQQQVGDMTQQLRQSLVNQSQGLIQANNILQQQQPIQNHQSPGNIPQTLHQKQQQEHQNLQQQIIGQNPQSSLMQGQFSDHVNQHIQASDNQIQFQLLQKLQQQRQSLLTKQTALQQSGPLGQLQVSPRQFVDVSQSLSRPVTPSQLFEAAQTIPYSLPQPAVVQQHLTNSSSQNNGQFPNPLQQPRIQQQASTLSEMPVHMGVSRTMPGLFPVAGSSTVTSTVRLGQSVITDEVPSCSTSPSTDNCRSAAQPMANIRAHCGMAIGEDMAQLGKDLQQKSDVKPSLHLSSSKNQNQGLFSPQTYLNGAATQADYLDTSSSTTSVGVSQNKANIQQNNSSLSYDPHSMLLNDTSQDGVLHVDPRIGLPTNSDIRKGKVTLGREMQNNLSSGDMLASCENSRDPQELSSSMVCQPFGVPDMTFNAIDSTMNEDNFLNGGPWAPTPQFQRMRTYTKVYKRGAVGRSIDIARYSGYDELKQDLARRFGIEGQLEDRQRIGWKLVYVDHENDVLLVGDDPWEEFVNCVRCIKILSPQEVQQMSLDVDMGASVLPNQACSSSDNGNA